MNSIIAANAFIRFNGKLSNTCFTSLSLSFTHTLTLTHTHTHTHTCILTRAHTYSEHKYALSAAQTHANLPLLFWSLEISVHYVWTFLSSDSPFFLFNLGHISLLTQALSLSFTLTLSLRFTSLHFVTSLSLSLSLSLLLPLSLNSLSATLAYHFVSCRSEEDQRRKLSFEIFG